MPIHDWTKVPAGLFHDFHQSWSIRVKDALNAGRLPDGLQALVEQRARPVAPDVVAVAGREAFAAADSARGNRIVVKHHLWRTIAVIEIVSPGNKNTKAALTDFVQKTTDLLRGGIHVLVVDMFPPTPRDPFGIHKAIWDDISEEEFICPPGKDRILASYEAGEESDVHAAYVEPLGVGDSLTDMPLFLAKSHYVMVPLEPTYQATWDVSPRGLREAVETGILPEAEEE